MTRCCSPGAPVSRAGRDFATYAEPGAGDMDLDTMLAALPDGWDGWDGWVIVEVDRASMDPRTSADVSRAWVDARLTG